MKTIYRIKNIQTNKIYIGSSTTFEFRKVQHLSLLRRNSHHSIHLQNSFNKWGEDRFVFEIIEEFKEGNILEREQYYLNTLLKANEVSDYFTKNGYNIARIAGTSTKCKRVHKYSVEGIYMESFNSVKDAAIAHNISSQTIETACKSSTRTGAGFQWRYKDEFFEVNNLSKIYLAKDKEGNIVKSFNSLHEIKEKEGIKTKSNILRAIKENRISYGYYWEVISRPV